MSQSDKPHLATVTLTISSPVLGEKTMSFNVMSDDNKTFGEIRLLVTRLQNIHKDEGVSSFFEEEGNVAV